MSDELIKTLRCAMHWMHATVYNELAISEHLKTIEARTDSSK